MVSSGCSDACGSQWLLGSWFPVGFLVPEAPQVSVVPWVHCSSYASSGSLDYLWFLGSVWFLLLPVVSVVPQVSCGSCSSLG